jgi:2-polyprenyl-3-methyl-5-hydroxy-6-metoxy-1,4-benzoquinol methylase
MNRQQRRAQQKANKAKGINNPQAHQYFQQGAQFAQAGNMNGAYLSFDKARTEDPKNPDYHAAAGQISLRLAPQKDAFLNAFHAFYAAHKLRPREEAYMINMAAACKGLRLTGFYEDVKAGIMACLNQGRISAQSLIGPWFDTITCDPELKILINPDDVDVEALKKIASDSFIIKGLWRMMTNAPEMEVWLKTLRRYVLDYAIENEAADEMTPLIAAIGAHCFLNEYVFSEKEEEKKAYKTIRAKLDGGLENKANLVAAYAMYNSLLTLPQSDEVEEQYKKGPISALVKQQISTPKEEQRIKETIPAIGGIENETSKDVRAMYEQNPYPRWDSIASTTKPTRLKDMKYLVAGCGTGLPVAAAAQTFPATKITGIDMSLTSMAYAKRKAQSMGLNNVGFKQIDILNLAELGEKFDFIECGGVLHHMKDPLAGWAALKSVLAPGGRMFIALYGKRARKDIFAGQDLVKEMGLGSSLEDIRIFRDKLFSLPEDHPAKPVLKQLDFYSTSNLRDLCFHIQERSYDLHEIKEALDELGLVCMGLVPALPGITDLYKRTYPDDPAMKNLDHWIEFEDKRPDIAIGMYKFFCAVKGEEDVHNPSVEELKAINLVSA